MHDVREVPCAASFLRFTFWFLRRRIPRPFRTYRGGARPALPPLSFADGLARLRRRLVSGWFFIGG
jgi:hypothetical protein